MEKIFCLHLSKEEAETLSAITYRTSGSPTTSRRKNVDMIGRKLREMGVSDVANGDIEQGLRFADSKCDKCGQSL